MILKNDFQSIEFDLENKDSIEWKFLDEQELKLNDKIYIKITQNIFLTN